MTKLFLVYEEVPFFVAAADFAASAAAPAGQINATQQRFRHSGGPNRLLKEDPGFLRYKCPAAVQFFDEMSSPSRFVVSTIGR